MAKKSKALSTKPDNLNLVPSDGDYQGKLCVLRESYFIALLKPLRYTPDLLFRAQGGFGCDPTKMGRAVFGKFGDGEGARIDRSDVEFFVVE